MKYSVKYCNIVAHNAHVDWLGNLPCRLAGLAGHSWKDQGPNFPEDHHLQEDSEGTGDVWFGKQSGMGGPDRECHLSWGKDLELVWEVTFYWLEIIRLNSIHSLGSGTCLLHRESGLSSTRVAPVSGGELGWAWLQLCSSANMCWSFFLMNERVESH